MRIGSHLELLDVSNTDGSTTPVPVNAPYTMAFSAYVHRPVYWEGSSWRQLVNLDDIVVGGDATSLPWSSNGLHISVFQAHLTDQAAPSAPASGTLILASFNQQGFSVPHYYDSTGAAIEPTRDNLTVVRNVTGGALTKGTAVYVSGGTGSIPTVAKAKADSATTMPAIGVLFENIANNGYGRCLMLGALENYDTSAFSVGDQLFVSSTVAGALTNVNPSTAISQFVGTVTSSGVGNGVILVYPKGGRTTAVTSLTGTAHQIIASASTGAVTLSTPQNIDTTSSPTFAAITLSGNAVMGNAPLTLSPGDKTVGPGGNSFNGGIMTHSTTGNYQVSAYQVAPTQSGTLPEWGPITEFVAQRTVDQSTNYQRISFTAMSDWAGPALNDAATDYRIQMEAAGTKSMLPLKITSQYNTSGLYYEYMTFNTDGTVQLFRRSDSPGSAGSSLGLVLKQEKRALNNVLTAAGTQNSPYFQQTGDGYDTSLHTADWKWFVSMTSNAGASTYKLQTRIDSASYGDALTVTDGGVVTATNFTVNGTTIPATGIYKPATNVLGFATNSTLGWAQGSGQELLYGVTSAVTIVSGVTPQLQLHAAGTAAIGAFIRYSTPGGGGASFLLGSSRHAAATAGTAVQSGDGLGTIICVGDDGTSFVNNVGVARFAVDGSVSTGIVPCRFLIQTMNSSGVSIEALRIDSSQNVITKLGIADQSYSYQTPATGFSITIANGVQTLILDPAAGLAAGTITMPSAPVDGQIVRITSTQNITALTVSANTGQSIKNAPTALTVSTTGSYAYAFIYRSSNTTWYRLQ